MKWTYNHADDVVINGCKFSKRLFLCVVSKSRYPAAVWDNRAVNTRTMNSSVCLFMKYIWISMESLLNMNQYSYKKDKTSRPSMSLLWRHNGNDGVLHHLTHDCLLKRSFRRRSKKTSKLCGTGLCAGKSPVTGESPAHMASNAEDVSIWWRHHVNVSSDLFTSDIISLYETGMIQLILCQHCGYWKPDTLAQGYQ